jgi:hypothetical protein
VHGCGSGWGLCCWGSPGWGSPAWVLDHERITGDGEPFEAVAIYEVRDGLIRKVWFVPGPGAAAE